MKALRPQVVTLTATVAAVALCGAAQAGAASYAPLDHPGPPLEVPKAKLAAALKCNGNLARGPQPVLLNPATGVTPDENFKWNYERAFSAAGRPRCAVTMPHHTLGDIQVAGDYLVHSIRTMHARAGRRIAVMGHSQGGMSMRWALRFWPDTRRMVDDVIGFAGSNHGTDAEGVNAGAGAPPASHQQGSGSSFIRALNSRAETFPGISYTEIYSRYDEVVTPPPGSGVHGGGGRITNVETQSVCPLNVFEHLTIGTVDPTAYALALDALTHDGPAAPRRIPAAVCSQLYQPGVNPANVDMYLQILSAAPGLAGAPLPINLVGAPVVDEEPPLRCYVFASCPAFPSAGGITVTGTEANDRLVGTPGNDVILCDDGDDRVLGLGGNDYISCGDGDDTINAGAGNDRVFGGAGNDFIRGAGGRDRIRGDAGRDLIGGGSGRDRLQGNSGRDRINGNSGADRARGGSGRDRIPGNSGNDRLAGGTGRDRISGNAGRDRLWGGPGRDRLNGGPGRDRVSQR